VLAIAVLLVGMSSGITIALIGGALALLITPVLRKALHK
jgi:hypothetical protein